jgi:hypothetical protein
MASFNRRKMSNRATLTAALLGTLAFLHICCIVSADVIDPGSFPHQVTGLDETVRDWIFSLSLGQILLYAAAVLIPLELLFFLDLRSSRKDSENH